MQLSEHFTLNELGCKCGCDPTPEILENMKVLAGHLEAFRLLGVCDVTSGHRCAKHNERVGGGKDSQHLHGKAADIKIRSMSGTYQQGLLLAGYAEAMILKGHLPQGGVGTYERMPTLLHYDYRGYRARWRHT